MKLMFQLYLLSCHPSNKYLINNITNISAPYVSYFVLFISSHALFKPIISHSTIYSNYYHDYYQRFQAWYFVPTAIYCLHSLESDNHLNIT